MSKISLYLSKAQAEPKIYHHGASHGTKDLKGDKALVRKYKTKGGKIKSEGTKDEVSDLIRYHMHHLGRHPGGQKQAIAIAMRQAGVSQKKSISEEEEDKKKEMDKAYVGFEKLKQKIAARGGVDNPGAVAAAIGRKKYGKGAFQEMASRGEKAPAYKKHKKSEAKKALLDESAELNREAAKKSMFMDLDLIKAKMEAMHPTKGPTPMTRPNLEHHLRHGTYSIVSAGRNSQDEHEKTLPEDHEMFTKRHEQLRGDLDKHGYAYTEVEGHYGGKERSFVVHHGPGAKGNAFMVHHDSPSEFSHIRELGKKYNQDSVIHSHRGTNEMHFTTGTHVGTHHKGSGHKMMGRAKDLYTEVAHPTGDKTRFQLNFDWNTHHPESHAVLKSFMPGLDLIKSQLAQIEKGRMKLVTDPTTGKMSPVATEHTPMMSLEKQEGGQHRMVGPSHFEGGGSSKGPGPDVIASSPQMHTPGVGKPGGIKETPVGKPQYTPGQLHVSPTAGPSKPGQVWASAAPPKPVAAPKLLGSTPESHEALSELKQMGPAKKALKSLMEKALEMYSNPQHGEPAMHPRTASPEEHHSLAAAFHERRMQSAPKGTDEFSRHQGLAGYHRQKLTAATGSPKAAASAIKQAHSTLLDRGASAIKDRFVSPGATGKPQTHTIPEADLKEPAFTQQPKQSASGIRGKLMNSMTAQMGKSIEDMIFESGVADMEKALKGPGSRGGKVSYRTKSDKPVYQSRVKKMAPQFSEMAMNWTKNALHSNDPEHHAIAAKQHLAAAFYQHHAGNVAEANHHLISAHIHRDEYEKKNHTSRTTKWIDKHHEPTIKLAGGPHESHEAWKRADISKKSILLESLIEKGHLERTVARHWFGSSGPGKGKQGDIPASDAECPECGHKGAKLVKPLSEPSGHLKCDGCGHSFSWGQKKVEKAARASDATVDDQMDARKPISKAMSAASIPRMPRSIAAAQMHDPWRSATNVLTRANSRFADGIDTTALTSDSLEVVPEQVMKSNPTVCKGCGRSFMDKGGGCPTCVTNKSTSHPKW